MREGDETGADDVGASDASGGATDAEARAREVVAGRTATDEAALDEQLAAISEGGGAPETPQKPRPVPAPARQGESPAGTRAAAAKGPTVPPAGRSAADAPLELPSASAVPKAAGEPRPARRSFLPALRLREEIALPWRLALGGLFILLVLGVWALLTSADVPEERIMSPTVLPTPGDVASTLSGLVGERSLIESMAATLTRVFLGFGLAVIVAVPLGILAAAWRPLGAFLAPLVLFGRNVPIAALIPLTMIWFGIDETQKVIFIFVACAPFIFSDAAAAVLDIPERYVETAQTLGASKWQIIRGVLVPLSLPATYTGLRTLFGLAFGYIMLAELVNAERGLGSLINVSQRRGAIADVYMVLLIITLLAFAIDRLFAFFQKGLFPHRQDP